MFFLNHSIKLKQNLWSQYTCITYTNQHNQINMNNIFNSVSSNVLPTYFGVIILKQLQKPVNMLYSRYSCQFYSFLEFPASPFYNDIQKFNRKHARYIQPKYYKYDMREKHTNMKYGGLINNKN